MFAGSSAGGLSVPVHLQLRPGEDSQTVRECSNLSSVSVRRRPEAGRAAGPVRGCEAAAAVRGGGRAAGGRSRPCSYQRSTQHPSSLPSKHHKYYLLQ